jgi:hypothetical protein
MNSFTITLRISVSFQSLDRFNGLAARRGRTGRGAAEAKAVEAQVEAEAV